MVVSQIEQPQHRGVPKGTIWGPLFVLLHDDVIKWKHFPRNCPFVRGIHRSPVNSPHKGQWRGALMFSLICAWINDWVNNREAGYLRRYRTHYDVIVMTYQRPAPAPEPWVISQPLCRWLSPLSGHKLERRCRNPAKWPQFSVRMGPALGNVV